MYRLCLLLLLLALPAPELLAQGFNAYSGRNHPELDWQVAETEHFRIMYPARLSGIEAEAAAVAEASYAALSENLDVTFDDKIRIYLSDEDDITNGFAVPFGTGYTQIWVHVNDIDQTWTGSAKWLRRVVPHELAHIFHYRAVQTRPWQLNFFLGDPVPRFWTEGLAQYETEQWDAQRGDRWLRTAVLDDRLSYDDNRSLWNGRLLYAAGNSQVRYFAEQYGDSTLARLLKHRRPVLFGLAKVHDFGDAFEEVVGTSYRDFYDDWRRHVNVYYNLLAAQMNNLDSLDVDPLSLPGQYLFDVQYSPDTSRVAVLALPSLRRPVRRLLVVDRKTKEAEVVAEGGIRAPVAWSPDGARLAFARTGRGDYGSLLTDVYLVEAGGGRLRRLTESRRAWSPTFAPDSRRLAFVAAGGTTANVFVRDLATGEERQVTSFTGATEIASIRWHPSEERLVMARFTAEGRRDLAILDLETGALTPITAGDADDRQPLWSPDGRHIAYTSLRDDVPNTFVYDTRTGTHRRVTYLVTGATAHDWLPPDSARAEGSLVVVANATKSGDEAFRVDALRTVAAEPPDLPEAYVAWTEVRPPVDVPSAVAPAPELVQARYDYSAWKNLTHVVSLGLPYYDSPDDWGVAAFTSWLEPLGKHVFFFAGNLSVASPAEHSYFLGSYVNNQWYPTLSFNAYRLPGSARLYGGDLLVETLAGGDVAMQWPLDWPDEPFTRTTVGARLRYVDVEPLKTDVTFADDVPAPAPGQQADLQLSLTYTKQRPYYLNVIHPLDGLGVRVQALGAARVLGADSEFVRGDLGAYAVLPGLGLQRLYLYGRAQAQTGEALPQDVLGLSRHDDVQIALPGQLPITFGEAERVRGYRTYALGDRVLFGTAEYRIPLLASLQTRLLGLASLGAVTLAAFADAGLVWSGADVDEAIDRVGVGLELKNALRLGGFLQVAHALGVAQPAADLGDRDVYEVYYRIRAAVPF